MTDTATEPAPAPTPEQPVDLAEPGREQATTAAQSAAQMIAQAQAAAFAEAVTAGAYDTTTVTDSEHQLAAVTYFPCDGRTYSAVRVKVTTTRHTYADTTRPTTTSTTVSAYARLEDTTAGESPNGARWMPVCDTIAGLFEAP